MRRDGLDDPDRERMGVTLDGPLGRLVHPRHKASHELADAGRRRGAIPRHAMLPGCIDARSDVLLQLQVVENCPVVPLDPLLGEVARRLVSDGVRDKFVRPSEVVDLLTQECLGWRKSEIVRESSLDFLEFQRIPLDRRGPVDSLRHEGPIQALGHPRHQGSTVDMVNPRDALPEEQPDRTRDPADIEGKHDPGVGVLT